jgi:hypothetical protein
VCSRPLPQLATLLVGPLLGQDQPIYGTGLTVHRHSNAYRREGKTGIPAAFVIDTPARLRHNMVMLRLGTEPPPA